MPLIPAAFVNKQEIRQTIDDVVSTLAPDVVFVGFSIGDDWMGKPSLFFRIVLSDEASAPDRLLASCGRVAALLELQLQPYQRWDLYPFFDFRSRAEQAILRDPIWEHNGVSR